MKRLAIVIISILTIIPKGEWNQALGTENSHIYFANGCKIGELASDSAIIWTRLTTRPERILDGPGFLNSLADGENRLKEKHFPAEDQIPDGVTLDQIVGAVPGADGQARLTLWMSGPTEIKIFESPWMPVTSATGNTIKFDLKNLKPETKYHFSIEAISPNDYEIQNSINGHFMTAPDSQSDTDILFTVAGCHDFLRRDHPINGHNLYPSMLNLMPDFFVHTGDIEYFDKTDPYATRLDLARFKFTRLYSMEYQRNFHTRIPTYWMKDDHDTLKNDCWPGQTYGELTFIQGIELFREQFPVRNPTYRTFSWGKNLQIWLMEGRDFRSPNSAKDGPEKSIWGADQKEWLFKTLSQSSAQFKVILSPTPMVGPDRRNKRDNYANDGFYYEGSRLRNKLGQEKNLIVICGDRHWQYASQDPVSGLREFSCGAGSDEHAGGFSLAARSPMHKFLAIEPGFISCRISGGPTPRMMVNFHGTNGKVRYSESIIPDI